MFINEKDCFSLKCVGFAGGCLYSLSPCFFSAVFSECQIAAPYCFSCAPAVSSYLRRRRKRKIKSSLDIHTTVTFLVSGPSQHHLRKERSSAPNKCCSPDNSRKKGTAFVKYTFVLFSAVTPQSDGKLLLVSRSPACLEGIGVLSQSPFAPRFLFRRAAASFSASVVPEVLFLH